MLRTEGTPFADGEADVTAGAMVKTVSPIRINIKADRKSFLGI
jgi:hypothetical protein